LLHFMDPTGVIDVPALKLNPMPASVAGLTIGIVDNAKPNADVVLGRLARAAVDQLDAADVASIRKRSEAEPAPPEDLDRLARTVNFAVGGLAE
jgi:hypothetical protein